MIEMLLLTGALGAFVFYNAGHEPRRRSTVHDEYQKGLEAGPQVRRELLQPARPMSESGWLLESGRVVVRKAREGDRIKANFIWQSMSPPNRRDAAYIEGMIAGSRPASKIVRTTFPRHMWGWEIVAAPDER